MLLAISTLCFVTVDPKTKKYITDDGRQLVMHGMNAVSKRFPYLPNITGEWDPENSMIDEDVAWLQKYGFNAIRLGVMWPGVYPAQDQVNQTYLDNVEKLINKLGQAGIYTMVDMHQDLLSAYLCGEGAPDWAMPYERKGVKNFAQPIKPEFARDPVTHYVDLKTCLETNFGVYYTSALVGNMFDCLYNASCNPFSPYKTEGNTSKQLILQEEMGKFWATVAKRFRNNQFVIGYDIINEPSIGDVWEHPGMAVNSAKYEREVLQPFYQNMMKKIYAEDPNHILFFEAVSSSIMKAGFDVNGPGAALGIPAEKQSYTWHLYCMTMDENGDPIQPKVLCDAQDEFWYIQRNSSGSHLNLSTIIDEFGALPDDDVSRELLSSQLQLFSQDGHSWMYWQYKPFADITTVFDSQEGRNEGLFNADGTIQTEKVKLLAHPFPALVAGTSSSHLFSFQDETLDLKFTTGKAGQLTEIPVSPLWQGFGQKFKFLSGSAAVTVIVYEDKIVLKNVLENSFVDILFWQ